jgi:hypothetical protein
MQLSLLLVLMVSTLKKGIRHKLIMLELLKEQQQRKNLCCCSSRFALPKELPSVEEALKDLVAAI